MAGRFCILTYLLHDLRKPEVQCHIHKGSPIIPILIRINPIARTDTILILYSYLRLELPKGLFPVGLPDKILKALLPSSILAT